jgi:hypothetical protein
MRSWSTFNQNFVNWNDIINKPSVLGDDLISWEEILDKPIIESGTFAPKLIDSNNFNYVHTLQTGKYCRIGNICCFDLRLIVNMAGAGTGILQVSSLPYNFSSSQLLNGYFHGITSNFDPLFLGASGVNKIDILYTSGTAASTTSTLRGSNFRTSGNFNLYCSGQIII